MKTIFVSLLVITFIAVKALPVEEVAVEPNSLIEEVENKIEDQISIASDFIREKRHFGGRKCKLVQKLKLINGI